jgi:hypothetical protein
MVAYTLPSDTDETAIRTGRRLGLLARPRRADARNTHGGPGSRVHLRIAANRNDGTRHLPTRINVLCAEAMFTPDGVQRVLATEAPSGAVEGLHALLVNAEQGSAHDRTQANDKLAVALGYDDYAALWADIGGPRNPLSVRTVIGWGPLA